MIYIYIKKAKALQNFGTNCVLNKYMHEEFKLGLHYLNAVCTSDLVRKTSMQKIKIKYFIFLKSIYMSHDRVALKGFGKMFKSFWYTQLENVDKLRTYILMRGGLVETPGFMV